MTTLGKFDSIPAVQMEISSDPAILGFQVDHFAALTAASVETVLWEEVTAIGNQLGQEVTHYKNINTKLYLKLLFGDFSVTSEQNIELPASDYITQKQQIEHYASSVCGNLRIELRLRFRPHN